MSNTLDNFASMYFDIVSKSPTVHGKGKVISMENRVLIAKSACDLVVSGAVENINQLAKYVALKSDNPYKTLGVLTSRLYGYLKIINEKPTKYVEKGVNMFKEFASFYFEAQERSQKAKLHSNGQPVFCVQDKVKMCEYISELMEKGNFASIHDIANCLSESEESLSPGERATSFNRHKWRLNRWMKQFNDGSLKLENAVSVKATPVEYVAVQNDIAKFKRNLIESAKSICHSAMKNNLSEDEIHIIFNSGLITAKEERKVQETKGALQAFLRQNGITKDIAMQILESA